MTSHCKTKAFDKIWAYMTELRKVSIDDLVTHTYWVNKSAGKKFSDVDEQCCNPISGKKWCPTYIFKSSNKQTAMKNWKAYKQLVKKYMDALGGTTASKPTTQFKQRTTAPSTTDRYWIHTSNGGLNECIEINNSGSCLPNCVGYAWGRFYEITGIRPKLSRANAENWYGYTSDSYIDSLKMIDIDLIEPNKNNFYEMSEIEALADDIERQGLMTALVVSEQNGGKYELISGHRRLVALKSLIADGRRRNGKVPCFIKGAKPNTETELDLIMLNATQRKYSDADTMREYEELTRIFKELEAEGKTIKGRIRDRIAEALNVSPAQVGKLDNIKHNAIPDVEQAVKAGDMSISTANEVAKLAPEKQQEIITEKPKISHKEVKEIQKQELSAEKVSSETDEEEDENEDDEDETSSKSDIPVTLSATEAETLSRYMDDLLLMADGEDFKVLRSLANKL